MDLSMQERARNRRNIITYTQIDLHSKEHHSFHTHLDAESSWELLAKISQEAWREQTGTYAPKYVDKSQYRFITRVS